MERISDNLESNLIPKESKFFLEDWNSAQKESYLKQEIRKVFAKNSDNKIITFEVIKIDSLLDF